ncbi:hypothetical protein ACSYAD_31085 [Acaryochloris marina NIES-2412]|uniref:hypothetical protein n=1 Tax=Acaryochloris marina TaxID=155978 RepID=UPI004057D2E8
MAADNKYSEVLLELKTHYQETLAELEAQASQLKTKIASLDKLIEDPLLGSDILSILQGEADSLTSTESASKVADTVEPKAKSKKTAPKAASKKKSSTPQKSASTAKTSGTVETKAEATPKKAAQKASPSSGKRKSQTSKKSASAPKSTQKVEPKAEATSKKVAPKASSTSSKKKSATPKKAISQTAAKKEKSQKKTSSTSSSSLTMNKPYDQMNKIDAISQIMQENPGKVMHNDDLIFIIFGELSGDELKAERNRMYKTMYDGTKQNRWIKSPNVPMSYIFEENSQVKPKESKKTKTQKSSKKS